VAVIGASYEAIMAAGDAERYPPPGKLVDVGGYRLHLHYIGEGSPAVIMEAGDSGNVLHWMLVQPAIARSTRICAYDCWSMVIWSRGLWPGWISGRMPAMMGTPCTPARYT
jgi:hypothetical protein